MWGWETDGQGGEGHLQGDGERHCEDQEKGSKEFHGQRGDHGIHEGWLRACVLGFSAEESLALFNIRHCAKTILMDEAD